MSGIQKLEDLLKNKEKEILEAWMKAQLANITLREDLMDREELRKESIEFLRAFVRATGKGNLEDITVPEYKKIIEILRDISKKRVLKGFSPVETATFIFSLKDSLFPFLQEAYESDSTQLNIEVIRISKLLDRLGLITFEEFAEGRETIIKEQTESLLELSSPIVSLWEGILAIPIIGTLDSRRTQQIMEDLLKRIVDTGSRIAIIDITGVGIMDTLVATHLLKTASAVKLLGAEAIITGIRPDVAQTIVHLGVNLIGVITKASMAEGLRYGFEKTGIKVTQE
ncbi:MAG: STAS domain-containing protein [bacterium]